jgi:hypothetical protein
MTKKNRLKIRFKKIGDHQIKLSTDKCILTLDTADSNTLRKIEKYYAQISEFYNESETQSIITALVKFIKAEFLVEAIKYERDKEIEKDQTKK